MNRKVDAFAKAPARPASGPGAHALAKITTITKTTAC